LLSDNEITEFVNRPRPASWFDRHYRELRDAIVAVMVHGVRYDSAMAEAKAVELTERKVAIKAELLELTGGAKLWSETKHRSPELIDLLEAQRRAKESYNAIPKEDKAGRKAYKPIVTRVAEAIKVCRSEGKDSIIEIGTGLSDDKICDYLYGTLKLTVIKKRRKESQTSTPTADDIALRKLRIKYPQHTKLFQLIMEHRKANKLMGYLNPNLLSPDGRLRCMYKPMGTQSGRLSSSEEPLGYGTNLQNFDGSLKQLMLPDEG